MTDYSLEEVRADLQRLTRTQLAEKYKRAHSSWSNMKQRAKKGATIAPEFLDFVDFLHHVGSPGAGETLDRIDNESPVYGPGLVRWRDKKGQANNRSTTVILTVRDIAKPLSVWADETGQKPDTLRRRHRDGWTDEEVVHGKKVGRVVSGNRYTSRPWRELNVKEPDQWEREYQKRGYRDETPIQFYFRIIGDEIRKVAKSLSVLVDQFGMEPDHPHFSQIEEKTKLYEVLVRRQNAGAEYAKTIDRSHREQGLERPKGWAGPTQFRPVSRDR